MTTDAPSSDHSHEHEITFGLLKGKAFSDNVVVITTKPADARREVPDPRLDKNGQARHSLAT